MTEVLHGNYAAKIDVRNNYLRLQQWSIKFDIFAK